MLAFFPMAFWDNLTFAENLLGCNIRFWERFFPEKVVILILQIERQFWVAESRGKCWPCFPHSCWDHLTLAESFFFWGGGNFTLEVIRFYRLSVKFG